MKKLSRKSLILEHYIQTAELVNDSMTVKLWKPKTMGKLPAYNMQSLMRSYNMPLRSYAYWSKGNYDAGLYDAQLTIYYDPHRKVTDIYICSILMRPFSREAYEHYGERLGLEPMDRLLLMWDSRQFDEEGGYKVAPTGGIDYVKSSINYEDVFHVINTHDDIEDSSC